MNLKFKLLSITGVGVIGFIIFGAITWNTLNVVKVNGDYYQKITLDKDLVADILPPPEYIIEPYLLLFEMSGESDQGKLKEMEAKFKGLQDEYEKRHEFWSKNLPEGRLKEQMAVKSYQPAKEFFEVASRDVIPAVLADNRDKTRELMNGILKAKYQEHRLLIDDAVKLANERLVKTESEVSTIVYRRTALLVVVALVIIALSIGLTWFFVEFRIIKKVVGIITGLESAAQQVAVGSAQISSVSQSLAQGSSEQAAGLEETSSSMEEMTSMTRQNADNAGQANTLMGETGKVVEEANQTMKELTRSMLEISSASEETGKIVKTIDEIAFQTNLLALNAAVEAARAGEAGAGFAVVADEVRNLAMRAAEAARNTSNLIEGTVKKIKNGSDIVGKTNEAFGKVSAGSRKAAELVGEIAAASNEQAQGIGQINQAVAEMDKVVQRNSASAEESASASEEMNAQAEQLKDLVLELIAVIGGHEHGNEFLQPKASPGARGHEKRIAIGHPVKSNRNKALPKPVGKGKESIPMVSAFKEVRPEEVIPMEEGEFKEF